MLDKQIVNGLGQFVARKPWQLLLFSILTIFFLSSGLRSLGFKNDYRIYFSKENPQLLAFEAIQNSFNKSDNLFFIIEPIDGDVFTTKTLEAIQQLTMDAWQLPYSSRVDSITNFQNTTAQDDDLIVSDLVSNPTSLTAPEIQSIKQIALTEPLLVNRLISKTGHVAGVNVTVQLPEKDATEATHLAEKARALVTEIKALYPGIKIHLTGIVMMSNAFAESAMIDNITLMPIMYGIVIIALILNLGSISATLSVILLIVFSVTSALGTFGWYNWDLTPTSAVSPTIILTVAVADCVHLLATMLHNMRNGFDKKEAIKESLRVNFQPIFLTSATTAIGFMSMNFSDAPPFRDLGNMVALGVVFAFLLTVTFLPALMVILPVRVKLKDDMNISYMSHLASFVINRRKFLLIGNLCFAIVMAIFIPRNELNDEFVKYFDETVEFRKATDFLNENIGGIDTIEFSIHSDIEGGINDPIFLQKIEQFSTWLKQQPEVKHVHAITDIYKRLNKNMHGDDSAWYKLPDQRDLAAQYLLMYEMSLPYGLDLNDQINVDKSGTRVVVTTKTLSSNQMLEMESRLNKWLKNNMPEAKSEAGSTALMFAHIGKRNIKGMIVGTMLALVLISLILILAFRSLKLGLISLIPNLAPAAVAFGIWALIDGKVGLGLSVVTGVTLGIVVDDTVHFISKYRRATIEKNLNSEQAVRYAFSTVGVAMWITTAVLVSGFIVLSFSHFAVNSDMGLLTAITIAIALWMDLFFLPPILMSLDKKEKSIT
ncbi:MAG: efflux RND transporter permease subunit [Gammaproteobacteria bacterium]